MLGIKISLPVLGFLLIFAAITIFLIRRRNAETCIVETDYNQKEVDTEPWKRNRAELDDRAISRRELATGREAHELEQNHGIAEAPPDEINVIHDSQDVKDEATPSNDHEQHELPA